MDFTGSLLPMARYLLHRICAGRSCPIGLARWMSVKSIHFLNGNQRRIEALWRDFFSDTSQWWDHRSEKLNLRFPDFKHKQTGESLWLADARNPQWVTAELAAIPPGALQSDVFAWAQRLKRHAKCGQYKKTIEVFHQMQQEGISPNSWTYLPVLNACAGLGALDEGKRIHAQIVQVGYATDVYVATCLVDMYAKCGSVDDAWNVFNKMEKHDVVSWNAMIGGYAKSGHGFKAMKLFRRMLLEGVDPDAVTFVGALNACATVGALEEGRHVHEKIIERGYESALYVANCLVDMYAKCGRMDDAWSVFSKMQEHSVVSWNAMIGCFVKSGQGLKAIKLFQKMQQEQVQPDAVTFVGVLNACASVAALEEGRRVHEQIIRRGCNLNAYVANCLVDMYAKCGSIGDAWSVFNKMCEHNVVSWSSMIGGYVKSGQGSKAIELFQKMQQERVEPNIVIFVGVLNACASVGALEMGRRVHEQITQRGCESDVYIATCLVDMYAKCGSIEDAWCVFNKIPEHDVVSWSAMIGGYMKSGQGLKALELFRKMQQEGVEANAITFVAVLNACASVADLKEGRHVHKQIMQRGCEFDVDVANCLVDMYTKCGSIEDAWSVLNKMPRHNVVSWNSMIGCYVKSGQGLKAIEVFREMQQEGVEPDAVTFVGVLNACASLAAVEEGRLIHKQIIQRGYVSDVYIATCLVDMYAKCGSIEDAWSVFNNMQEHDVVSWNAMIGGHVKAGQGLKAMELFRNMQLEGLEPDAVTFVGMLNACASVAALEQGRHVHEQIIQRGCDSDVYVANCLVDMYAKCGSIEDAQRVFNKMPIRNVVAWTAIIRGYAMHGHAKEAIELFEQMSKEGVEIDGVTFTCLLSACSHVGLVKEGLRFFKSMTSCFKIAPTIEHYACIIDLLSRAGRLEEAEEITKRMPERNLYVWMSLLGACRIHGHIEMAERAAKRCWEFDPENASGHVLLSNIYAASEKWDKAAATDEEVWERRVWKEPGCTYIEVNNVVYSFAGNDKEHLQILEINAELDRLSVQMNQAGYISTYEVSA